MKKPVSLYLCLILLAACGPKPDRDVMVKMRDGVRLLTDVYLPDGEGPFPVILCRVPYGTRSEYVFQDKVGRYFADRGFAYVAQDVRGRFGSEGVFNAYTDGHEIPDAYDTIDWIIEQDWSNDNIGVMGESYYGYTTLAAAASGHPAIKAISPANITIIREKQTLDGAYPIQASGMWTLDMDDAEHGEYQDTSAVDINSLPLIDWGKSAGIRDVLWKQRVTNHLVDPQGRIEKAYAQLGEINVPGLYFGGWYDSFTRGSIDIWNRARQGRRGDEQWLVMGPWDHESMSAGVSGYELENRVGKIDIGDAAAMTYYELLTEFFTNYLKQEKNDFEERPPVLYFNIGDNGWRQSDAWPEKKTRFQSLYLSDGALDDAVPEVASVASYRYDPGNPVTITADTNVWSRAAGQPDRSVLLERDDVLTYESDVLDNNLDISGPITVQLYASSSAVDTDFTAALVDVFPDGYSLLIQEGILRMSFRDKTAPPSPIEAGKVYRLDIDLWATSFTVPAGHKLRVEISSSNFPRFARNLNTGEPFGMSDRVEVAEQTIYHSREYPSRLVLPVID